MLNIIIILFYILIMFFVRVIYKNNLYKNVIIAYTTWTFFIIIISNMNPFGLDDVDNKVYIIWIVNILLTVISSMFFIKKNVDSELDIFNTVSNFSSSKLFTILNVVVFIGLVYFFIRYNSLAEGASAYDLRVIRFTTLFNSSYEQFIFDYIIGGILKINMLVLSLMIINKDYKRLSCIFGIINIILYTMIGYGRLCIFEFCLYLLFAFLISNKKINFKTIFRILIYTFFIFLVLSFITAIRIIGIEKINYNSFIEYGVELLSKQLIIYFIGGFRTLNSFINSVDINNYKLGRMTFAGFEDLFSLFTGFLGIGFFPINNSLGAYTQKTVLIGYKSTFNAFYTAIFNFYGDFGIIGVVVFSLVNGLFLSASINNLYKKRTISSFMLFIYSQSMLLCTIYRWNYQFGNYLVVLLALFLLEFTLNKKIKRRKNYVSH